MKLHRLWLKNFRAYRGEQEILFATDSEKNITMIWGANGSGKTTLLNAFTWALYGTFTEDTENQKSIFNLDEWNRLGNGERLVVGVELEFEDSGRTFTVRRTSRFKKGPDGTPVLDEDGKLSMSFIDESGRSQKSGNPQEHLKQILPERLHNFFFFNGERIENLVKPKAYVEIEDAIKTILGLAVVERAIKHLPTSIRKFEDELRKHGTDEQREATTELSDLESQIASAEEKLAESRENEIAYQEEKEKFDEKLRGSEIAHQLQSRRDILTAQELQLDQDVITHGNRIDDLIRKEGFLAAGAGLFALVRDQFVDKRERKELPAPVKMDFIDDLLDDGVCICGGSLAEGTEGHDHIIEWKQRAGLAEVEERWIQLHSWAGHLEKSRKTLGDQLNGILEDRATALEQRQRVREQISEVSGKLESHSIEEISELESARIKIEDLLKEEVRKQGRAEAELLGFRESKRSVEARLEKAKSVEAKADLAQRRMKVTNEALSLLEKIFEVRTQDTRSSLDAEIKRIYSSISFKSNVPQLKENFQLELLLPDSEERAAKSTGENQILSLSFVGALASIARQRFEETSNESGGKVRGGIYPIVMDAAFGSLDRSYQRDVAIGLPQLAEQVVVIVSKSQGEGVLEHLSSRIGRSYVICYTTPKVDVDPEHLVLGNEPIPYIQPSLDKSEFAEILEIL